MQPADQQKTFWNIDKLTNWKDNPRAIKKENFEKLKQQLQELGQYKPLIITPEGEVLGGNMRLHALKELGIIQVWVSIVNPQTEAEKLKYALSDNSVSGYFVDTQLEELVVQNGIDIKLETYTVNLGEPRTLTDVLNHVSPEPKKKEEKPESPKTKIKCPNCDFEF